MELGFCMETMFLYGFMTLSMEVFVWILVVPFLGFSWESILTLDLLKVGLVIPYFVQDELGILSWVWILGVRCLETCLGVRNLT